MGREKRNPDLKSFPGKGAARSGLKIFFKRKRLLLIGEGHIGLDRPRRVFRGMRDQWPVAVRLEKATDGVC